MVKGRKSTAVLWSVPDEIKKGSFQPDEVEKLPFFWIEID